MTTSPTSGQQWEQPAFDAAAARPYVTGPPTFHAGAPRPSVTGPVLLPVITQVDLPAPTREEQNLRTARALIWPIVLVLCFVTGNWWPFLLVPVIVGAFLNQRLRELRRQRYSAAQLLR